jgi:ATP-binding cassette subfamily A (ABC1) protein 3
MYFSNTSPASFEYTQLVNTRAPEAAAVFANVINRGVIRTATNDSDFKLITRQNPFPLTVSGQAVAGIIEGYLAGAFLSIGVGFIPASIVALIVKERTQKVKHQQLVMGLKKKTYWLGNLGIDLAKYLVFASASAVTLYYVEADNLSRGEGYEQMIWVLFGFGLPMIAFTYVVGSFFQNHGSAQVWIFLVFFLSGNVFSLGLFILRIFDSTRTSAIVLSYVLKLFPPILFGVSVLDITNIFIYIYLDKRSRKNFSYYQFENCGQNIFFIFFDFFLYMGILYYLETRQNKPKLTINQAR